MHNAISGVRLVIMVLALAGTAVFLHARRQAEKVVPRQSLASFPMQIAGWEGKEIPISQGVRDVLGAGDFMQRVYARSSAESYVDLFVAYFPSQRTGNTMHSPKNCLPGSGWTPLQSSRAMLGGTVPAEVNRYVIAKGMDRQLVLYWYQSHNRSVASEYWAKAYLVWDAMRTNRTDGALVRVITPMAQSETVETAEARAAAFAQQVLPLLKPHIPE